MTAKKIVTAASLAVLILCAESSRADSLTFGPHDVQSLFTITKSENKNTVAFAIRLDEKCAPVGDAPVFPYWRMLELGPNVLEPLLPREQDGYGIASQRVLARNEDGGRVEITLRALSARPITIDTKLVNGACTGASGLRIAGENGFLYNVYVKLWTFGVDHLLLSGWSADRSRILHETIER